MSILEVIISRDDWLKSIYSHSESKNSAIAYNTGIKKWDAYLEHIKKNELEVLRELREKNQETATYVFLAQYIGWLKSQGLKKSAISVYFAALRSWCAANGVMLYSEHIKRFVKLPNQNKERKVPLKMEDIKALVNMANSKRMKCILLVLLSSGMRIGEVLQLKVEDVNASKFPVQLRVRAMTTKTREERVAYISVEAWNYLQILMQDKKPDEFIFVKEFNVNTMYTIEALFNRLRRQCGLLEKYDDDLHYHVHIHAFRAFYHTVATKILGGDTAHAMLGHHEYLDQYFRLDDAERAELYKKLEPHLTISDEHRQKIVIEEKDKQIAQYERLKEEIILLKAEQKRQARKSK